MLIAANFHKPGRLLIVIVGALSLHVNPLERWTVVGNVF